MKISNKYIYRINSLEGEFSSFALGEKNLSINYTKEDDFSRYDRQLTGTITFKDEAFNKLMEIETSINRCSKLTLQIFRKCESTDNLILENTLNLNNARFDLDRCTIEVEFEKQNIYRCVDESIERNLFDIVDHNKTIRISDTDGVYEEVVISYTRNANPFPRGLKPIDFARQIPDAYKNQGYVVKQFNATYTRTEETLGYSHVTEYTKVLTRKVVQISCGELIPRHYILAEDDCVLNGTRTYWYEPMPYSYRFNGNDKPSWYNTDEGGVWEIEYKAEFLEGLNNIEIDNGMLLTDVLRELIDLECGLDFYSDFFENEINPITEREQKGYELLLFQRSDVIRYSDDYENATIANIKLSDLLEKLCMTFNLGYGVVDNIFRIEHISFFRNQDTIDLTQSEFKKFINKKRKYRYDSTNFYSSEIFSFDLQGSDLWEINRIDYDDCNISETKENSIDVEDITTDVMYLFSNEENENTDNDDLKGFVLVYARNIGSNLYSNNRHNSELSWFNLIQDYHFYNRQMPYGMFNDYRMQFYSTKLLLIGEEFSIPFCLCDFDNFNVYSKYRTELGDGYINSMEINLSNEYAKLELAYEYDLFHNVGTRQQNPVIYPNNFQTELQTTIIEPIAVHDEDGFIQDVVIVENPENGILEIVREFNQFSIKYTPNDNYTGLDWFKLKAIDNEGYESNEAQYQVNILNNGVGDYPTLVYDKFLIINPLIGTEYYAGNVLENDTANSPLGELEVTGYEQTSFRINENQAEFRIEPNGDLYVTFNQTPVFFQFKYTAINDSGLWAEQYGEHTFIPADMPPRAPIY